MGEELTTYEIGFAEMRAAGIRTVLISCTDYKFCPTFGRGT